MYSSYEFIMLEYFSFHYIFILKNTDRYLNKF